MKLLSVAIPSYNSERYMRKCVESLLPGGDRVEILIVDDGSTDRTGRIADEYQARYPGIVRAIHQVNKGHGGAVNTGLEYATGVYFKVVDSDDWVAAKPYQQILDTLELMQRRGDTVDMMLSNFIYDKVGVKHKKVMSYRHVFPVGEIFTWDQMRHIRKGQYILMHSVIYRTQMLKECGLQLPEHTFYVDNIFVYNPLPFVKKIYYLDVNFYHYFIGRADQSVNRETMVKRVDQQLRVNHIMIDAYDLMTIPERKLRKYMYNYLEIIMTISSAVCIQGGTEEHLAKKDELWNYLHRQDAGLYRRMRHGVLGTAMNLPGKGGRKFAIFAYDIANKIYGFN